MRILGRKTVELMASNNLPPQIPDIGMKDDLVALYFTQFMPSDFSVIGRFQTLVYQAIVE